MRYYCHNEPIWGAEDDIDEHGHVRIYGNRVVTKSEEDIRREYFPYWESRMIAKYGEEYHHTYSFEDCLWDWMVLYWGWESDDG